MLFQRELLNRQCPVPEREKHPAFHGMLLAERLLGLSMEGSGQLYWQMQPQHLLLPVATAKGTSDPTDGRLGSPKL